MSNAHAPFPLTLPTEATSKAGEIFYPGEDVWDFSSSSRFVHLRFAPLRAWGTDALVDSIKGAMAREVRRLAPRSVERVLETAGFCLLRHAYTQIGRKVDHITLDMIQSFGMSLDERRRHELAFVKMFGRALLAHGNAAHSIEPAAIDWLIMLKQKSAPSGEAVRTMNPIKGPLLLSEDRILMRALHGSFERNEIKPHVYLKVLLFRLSGMRPAAIADLKCKDLRFHEGVYSLACPRVKSGQSWRQTFETWTLLPEVGALLAGFIADQKAKWKHLNMGEDLPIFVHARNRDPIRTYHQVGGSLAKDLPTYLSHLHTLDPSTREPVRVRSPRTGQPFRIYMRRFRISLATWALLRGATMLEVARLLGHASVGVSLNAYAAIDVSILEENDRKMAGSEVRVSGYFCGQLVDENQAIGTNLYPDSSGVQSVGRCRSLCSQRKPFACYTCHLFQALVEGAHEEVLQELETERDHALAGGGSYQVHTHDMTINAVKQVISMKDARLCRDGLNLHHMVEVL